MEASDVKRLKELQPESEMLKHTYAAMTLESRPSRSFHESSKGVPEALRRSLSY